LFFPKISEAINMKIPVLLVSILFLFVDCQKQLTPIEISAEDFHLAQDELTAVMVHDIFSPPLASRVYAYSNIAAYEILAQTNDYPYSSYASVLKDFNGITPVKDSLVNHKLSALIAFLEVGKNLIFSVDRMSDYIDGLSQKWMEQNSKVYSASYQYARQVVGEISLV